MSIWELARWTENDIDSFAIHCGNFLDAFYRASNDQRESMVEREPEKHPSFPDYLLPFLAAMAHKLCNEYDVDCPSWVHKDQYVLKEPHF